MDIFSILFYQPIYNLLIVLYRLFSENLGLAIILVAVLSRLITLPITLRQIEMGEKNQKLSKDLKAIQEKYKDDKQKQIEEMAKMQSQFMTGMLGAVYI
jgi:YidC/Oxa1 family membrane protein insertase